MEQKKGDIAVWTTLVTFLAIITIIHSISHFTIYGTGIRGLAETGVSGLAIGNIDADNLKNEYPSVSPFSRIILLAEWFVLIILGTMVIIARKISLKEEVVNMNALSKKDKEKSKTDIDLLLEVLREKKHLRISTVARIFKISKEKALEWCQILEDANLAAISYPRMGEPEVIITS